MNKNANSTVGNINRDKDSMFYLRSRCFPVASGQQARGQRRGAASISSLTEQILKAIQISALQALVTMMREWGPGPAFYLGPAGPRLPGSTCSAGKTSNLCPYLTKISMFVKKQKYF